jgi:hypothetical protein
VFGLFASAAEGKGLLVATVCKLFSFLFADALMAVLFGVICFGLLLPQ